MIKEAVTSSPKNENIRIITDSNSFTKVFKATRLKKWSLKKPSKGIDILKRIKRIIRKREKIYESTVTFTHIFFHIERKNDRAYKREAKQYNKFKKKIKRKKEKLEYL